MNNKLPIKFSWGVFCRRVITDKETGEASIIDIIPALKLEQVFPIKVDNDNPRILLPLGQIYATTLFERSDLSENEINQHLNIEFLQLGQESILIEANILMRSTEFSTFINLNLGDLPLAVSPVLGVSDYTFEIIYRVNDQELGKVILPVKVEFKSLEDK
jgi:hypothetical protein